MITVKTKDSTTFISEDNVQVVHHDEKEKTVTVTIDMGRYSTGIYYYGIEVDGVRQMRKMILR